MSRHVYGVLFLLWQFMWEGPTTEVVQFTGQDPELSVGELSTDIHGFLLSNSRFNATSCLRPLCLDCLMINHIPGSQNKQLAKENHLGRWMDWVRFQKIRMPMFTKMWTVKNGLWQRICVCFAHVPKSEVKLKINWLIFFWLGNFKPG